MKKSKLAPGSAEALKIGCLCPIMDNRNGAGRFYRGERVWYVSSVCALHYSGKP